MLRGEWRGHFDDQIDGAAVAQPQPPLQPEPRLQPQMVPQLQPQTVPQLQRVEQQLGQEQRQRQQRKMPHEGLQRFWVCIVQYHCQCVLLSLRNVWYHWRTFFHYSSTEWLVRQNYPRRNFRVRFGAEKAKPLMR
jgi:hypothetical protein